MGKITDQILVPAAMMASLIIGAGMFSLPYVFARSGAIAGVIYLVLMALVAMEVHRSYAEVVEAAGESHRFAGYAEKYLGKTGSLIGGVSVVGGIILTLAIYLTLSGSFIGLIFPDIPGIAGILIFWAIGGAMIASGIKKFAGLDLIFFLGIIITAAILAAFGLVSGDIGMFSRFPADMASVFLPFAPVLFALSGRSAISSMREYFSENRYDPRNLKKAIALGTVVPVAVYAAFVFGVTALSSQGVTTDAVSGLSHLPGALIAVIGVLGFSAVVTSYIFLGMEFRGIMEKDAKVRPWLAALIAVILPLALHIAGLNNFITLVGLVGGVFLAIESMIVISMRRAATLRRRPYDLILIAVFLGAVVYEIISFFGA